MCQKEVIGREHFPIDLQANIKPSDDSFNQFEVVQKLPVAIENLEKRLLSLALDKTKGNKRKAARLLGVTERVLGYKVKHLKL